MKALLICTGGGIGDVLLATPLVAALRSRYDEVVALTSRAGHEVLIHDPSLAAVWIDDAPFATQAARIAAGGFDAAIVTWATLRAAALPFFAKVPVRVGQSRRLYSRLFTHRVEVRSERGDHATHWTQILLDFGRAIECDTALTAPRFVVTGEERSSAGALLAAHGICEPFVIFHPTRGISAVRERWPSERLGELGAALRRTYGCELIVSGTREDAAVAGLVAERSGGTSLAGRTTLGVVGALAERARGVVAMDSGVMHVAAAVGAPTVGIFALRSDEPDRWRPLGERTAVVRGTYPCPPHHRKETCPDFACIANLEIDRVVSALRELLRDGTEAERERDASSDDSALHL